MDKVDRLKSLVHSIEDEMHKSGINVNFTKLKDHLLQLQESDSEVPLNIALDGEFVEVGCNSPHHSLQSISLGRTRGESSTSGSRSSSGVRSSKTINKELECPFQVPSPCQIYEIGALSRH